MTRRIILALAALVLAACLVGYCTDRPAGADYSDHGTVPSSLVPAQSTERDESGGYGAGGGELAETGIDAETLGRIGLVLFAGGVAFVLAARKREVSS